MTQVTKTEKHKRTKKHDKTKQNTNTKTRILTTTKGRNKRINNDQTKIKKTKQTTKYNTKTKQK